MTLRVVAFSAAVAAILTLTALPAAARSVPHPPSPIRTTPAPTLVRLAATAPGGPACIPGGALCLILTPPADGGERVVNLVLRQSSPNTRDRAINLAQPLSDEVTAMLWDRLIILTPDPGEGNAPRIVFGVIARTSVMYSGGGGASERLTLYRLLPSYDATEVLNVPWSTNLMIRACFSEHDFVSRAGACHDESEFDAQLRLVRPGAPAGAALLPPMVYSTKAHSFPRSARRSGDSEKQAPLRRFDLVKVRDPLCSYARVIRYNPATDRYEFSYPAPDCSEFTEP